MGLDSQVSSKVLISLLSSAFRGQENVVSAPRAAGVQGHRGQQMGHQSVPDGRRQCGGSDMWTTSAVARQQLHNFEDWVLR